MHLVCLLLLDWGRRCAYVGASFIPEVNSLCDWGRGREGNYVRVLLLRFRIFASRMAILVSLSLHISSCVFFVLSDRSVCVFRRVSEVVACEFRCVVQMCVRLRIHVDVIHTYPKDHSVPSTVSGVTLPHVRYISSHSTRFRHI